MTQNSLFWTTSGTGDGVAAGYTPEQVWTLLRALFGGDGVALDFLNELAPTLVLSTATIASGAALVAGIPYTNDAAIDTAVPAPTAQNRYDRMVLRANWQWQTVRVVRLAGVEGVMTPTTLTQQRGGIYEIALATIGVDVQRVIGADTTLTATTYVASLEVSDGFQLEVNDDAQLIIEEIAGLTDDRSWLTTVHSVLASQLAAAAVTTAKLADNAVSNAKLLDMAAATVLGRVSSGTGDPEAVTMAQLIALLATTTPDRLIDAVTTLAANWTVEWIEVANGYSMELSDGVALTLADGGWTGIDADTIDGSQAAALALHSHTHSAYSPVSHTHSGYATPTHTHDYAPASHTHSAYSSVSHTHSAYAAAAHSHASADIADNAVANSDLADMAEATVKGRAHGSGTGDPDDLTAAQVVAMLITLNGVADGIDADLLDGMHASELATPTHTHSGYATPTHTHSGYATPTHNHDSTYAASDHEHDTTKTTITLDTIVASGTVTVAVSSKVAMVSIDVTVLPDGAGSTGLNLAIISVVPILYSGSGTLLCCAAGINSAGNMFLLTVGVSGITSLECAAGIVSGETYQATMVFPTT